MRWTLSAAALVSFVAQAQAQYLVNELSFGYGSRYGHCAAWQGLKTDTMDE
jgi:hypothetical protein